MGLLAGKKAGGAEWGGRLGVKGWEEFPRVRLQSPLLLSAVPWEREEQGPHVV